MKLNELSPSSGERQSSKRVGRGPGSTLGKTCGRGDNGQKSRSGGYHKVGFEGGQMPLQLRVPKFGFSSNKFNNVAQVRLHELNRIQEKELTLDLLKAYGLVRKDALCAKVIAKGDLKYAFHINHNIKCSKGAQEQIKRLGGSIKE